MIEGIILNFIRFRNNCRRILMLRDGKLGIRYRKDTSPVNKRYWSNKHLHDKNKVGQGPREFSPKTFNTEMTSNTIDFLDRF